MPEPATHNPPQPLTSAANPRVKALVKLRDGSRHRIACGRFVVESLRELRRAIAGGFNVIEVYATAPGWDMLGRDGAVAPVTAAPGVERFLLTDALLAKAAYRHNPQGFIAVVEARDTSLARLIPVECGLYVVCGGLEKPGNLGAVMRSADAAGAAAVLIDRPDPDVYNPNCIRASTGAVFGIPIAAAEPDRLIDWLASAGARIIALSGDASRSLYREDLRGPIAIVVGSEAHGLDAAWRRAASALVSIPMRGTIDSLNVSTACAVALFEAARQRRG